MVLSFAVSSTVPPNVQELPVTVFTTRLPTVRVPPADIFKRPAAGVVSVFPRVRLPAISVAPLARLRVPVLTVFPLPPSCTFPDTVSLGQSPLLQELKIKGKTHLDRGNTLREELVGAIDTLRPEGPRPAAPIPREWQNYVVLHDAYIEGIVNHEIMTSLYISEGTFNRIRRKALRGVARYLLEKAD